MSVTFEINAEVRTDAGKGASRRLRHTGKIPAIIYGGGKDPVALTVEQNKLAHALENEAFYSHILTINVDGKAEQAVLRDLQRHPARPLLLHADFQRVSATEKLHMHVPLHFVGEATGVKDEGGVCSHTMSDVEVSCLGKDLPEFIEVDVTDLALGHALHLSDLTLPEGVELVQLAHGPEHDLSVVNVHKARVAKEEDDDVAAAEGDDAPAAEGDEPTEG